MHVAIELMNHFHTLVPLGVAQSGSTWDQVWRDLADPGVPWREKILRPIFVYFLLIVGLRLAGKRELAQLNPFDLIVLLTLSNTVQNAIIGDDNSLSGGIVGAATLLAVNYIVIRVTRHSPRLERLLAGRSDVLISRGKVREKRLEQELMSKAELLAAAHKQGIASLDDVERCVLEPTGTISFLEKRPTHESERHDQLLALLAQIRNDLAALRPGSGAAALAGNAALALGADLAGSAGSAEGRGPASGADGG